MNTLHLCLSPHFTLQSIISRSLITLSHHITLGLLLVLFSVGLHSVILLTASPITSHYMTQSSHSLGLHEFHYVLSKTFLQDLSTFPFFFSPSSIINPQIVLSIFLSSLLNNSASYFVKQSVSAA